jgi:hypothetical protein
VRFGTVLALAGVVVLGLPWLASYSQQLQPVTGTPPSPDQQVVSSMLPTGIQQIVVIDQRQQAMATYHIEPQAGKIRLMSVRSLRHDLALEEFNATSPLPSEMRLIKP